MTSMISKYKHVRITWQDICTAEEAWTHESEILAHDVATCTDTGCTSTS